MDGSLGLPVENLPGYMPRSSQYPFVAVDFDIFTNKEESIDDPEWEHVGWEQCVLHRDIKSSKVMLDANLTAKLGNFGLARLVDHGKQSKTTTLAGTMGYKARLAMNLMFTALELLLWR
ncbi:hypothetical protein ACFX1X_031179 [Malus domestica]